MQKKIIMLLLITTMCFLNACSIGGVGVFFESDETKAAKRLEKIIESINNKDEELLKGLFSQKALDDTTDFDENMLSLFEFIEGEIISWEKSNGLSAFDSIENGKKTKLVNSFYYVTTTKEQRYFFLIDDYQIDTINPDNAGLYLLLAVKEEDEKKIWSGANKIIYDGDVQLSPAGICVPLK